MLARLGAFVSASVRVALEVAGLVVSVSGSALAVFVGKLFLAVVLAAIALGFVLRLSGRRGSTVEVRRHALPAWVTVLCTAVALFATAVLAEATNLPVRVDQPGFHPLNWALVLVSVLALYSLSVRAARQLLGGGSAATSR